MKEINRVEMRQITPKGKPEQWWIVAIADGKEVDFGHHDSYSAALVRATWAARQSKLPICLTKWPVAA